MPSKCISVLHDPAKFTSDPQTPPEDSHVLLLNIMTLYLAY